MSTGRKYLPLLTFVAIVSLAVGTITPEKIIASRDFICYWTAAHLLIEGTNPYSDSATLTTEKGAGYSPAEPLIVRNPPQVMVLLLPLGMFGPKAANTLWMFLVVGSIALSIHLIADRWTLDNDDRTHILGYLFAPVLVCIIAGQLSAFLLLGLVLFLRWQEDDGFAAGLALSIFILKPHLLLPFAAALLLWIAHRRRFDILAGASCGALLLSAIATAIRPSLWGEYATMMRSPTIGQEFYPTVSGMLRGSLSLPAWVQFLPALIGCLWAAWYYQRNKDAWQWTDGGLLLIVVSLFVAPRAWMCDEIIALPAILAVFYRRSSYIAMTTLSLASIAALVEVFAGAQMDSAAYAWTTTVWAACFIYATKSRAANTGAARGCPERITAVSA